MKENNPKKETPLVFTAYSGTTLANFKHNSYVSENNTILYDKLRNPKHEHKGVYFDIFFKKAAEFSVYTAFCTKSSPVVMSSELPTQFRPKGLFTKNSLPEGMELPVKQVWIPKDTIDIEDLWQFVHDEKFDELVQINPLELLT